MKGSKNPFPNGKKGELIYFLRHRFFSSRGETYQREDPSLSGLRPFIMVLHVGA